MKIAAASAFRNSSNQQILRWMSQLVALRAELREHYYCSLRTVAVEGDSTDETAERLQAKAARELAPRDIGFQLVTCNHGGPVFGSTEAPERMVALSKVGNAVFDAVRPDDDVLVYVESDLIWDAETIRGLIDYVTTRCEDVAEDAPIHVIAPMVFAGDNFYDVFAYRGSDGARFSPFPPYHSSLKPSIELVEVSSAGSCLVMTGEVARCVRIKDDNALVGWCAEARRRGYRIWVAPELRIAHPC